MHRRMLSVRKQKRPLSSADLAFIRDQKSHLSSRQIADRLAVSRAQVEAALKTKSFDPVRGLERFATPFWLVLLCLLTAALYCHTFPNKFLWDDASIIVNDKTIEHLSTLPQ